MHVWYNWRELECGISKNEDCEEPVAAARVVPWLEMELMQSSRLTTSLFRLFGGLGSFTNCGANEFDRSILTLQVVALRPELKLIATFYNEELCMFFYSGFLYYEENEDFSFPP